HSRYWRFYRRSNNRQLRVGSLRQSVDRGATAQKVGDHLCSDLCRVRADTLLGDAVIGGEDHERFMVYARGECPLDRGYPAGNVFEPAQALRRFGQAVLAGQGVIEPALLQKLNSTADG